MRNNRLSDITVSGVIAYYMTLALAFGFTFAADDVFWGLSLWRFSPPSVFISTVIIAAIAPLGALYLIPRDAPHRTDNPSGNRAMLLWSIATAILIAVLWFFRVRIHLLGDGYTLLGFLSDTGAHPFIKPREIGEGLLHIWMRSFWMSVFGVSVKDAALLSFQTISIASGALALTATFFLTKRLFESRIQRLIFGAGLLSGGYALLFFGYVENYSAFVAAVIGFTLVGLAALRNRRLLVFVVILAALAIWLHILGVTLLIALCYALFSGTTIARRISHMRQSYILGGLIVLAVGAGYLFWHVYTTNSFFQFAFLHLTDTRFDTSGYTLFSASHLTDLLNLLFILCPWFGLGIVALFTKRVRNRFAETLSSPEARFLTILSASTILALFVLNPKLGLGRDWDLFAFTAVPVTALFFYTGLKHFKDESHSAISFMLLALLLNGVTLVSRVNVLQNESASVAYYKSLIANDTRHLQSAVQNLQDYYFATGDSTAALAVANQYANAFPEVALVKVSQKLSAQKKYAQAIDMCRQALALNPQYSPGYANIGVYFSALGKSDSAGAYLEIANGLNPYNWITQEALGVAHFNMGEKTKGEKLLRHLLETTDSLSVRGFAALMQIAADNNDMQQYHKLLKKVVLRPDAPAVAFVQLGDYYVSQHQLRPARTAYLKAVSLGADSVVLQEFETRYGDSAQ